MPVNGRAGRGFAARAFVLALFAIVLGSPATGWAAGHPLDRFFDATIDPAADRRDSLATAFNPVQLPLVAAALVDDPHLDRTGQRTRAYQALVRWHFWTGVRWDPAGSGLWSVDPGTVPVGAANRGRVLSAHAGLELVQLAALARLAGRTDDVFDALVWWNDHAHLRDRLQSRLLDGTVGAHVDLDSVGSKRPGPSISSAMALATGLAVAPDVARQTHWRLWTGRGNAGDGTVGPEDRLHALERAEAVLGWTTDAGLRLLEPAATASLIQSGIDALHDRALSELVRDAFGGAGLAPDDSVTARLGAWTRRVPLDAVAPRPFERARIAVHALDRLGVLTREQSATLPARIDSLVADGSRAALETCANGLTALLAEWRTLDSREQRHLWTDRRLQRTALARATSAFRWRDGDAALWFERALDLVTEDVVAHHLRARSHSDWTARLEPAVAGRGDALRLRVRPEPGSSIDALGPVHAVWTDGRQILPVRPLEFTVDGSDWVADPGPAPRENGLWRVVVEGLPDGLRLPPAVSVVDPLRFHVGAVERRGRVLTYRVEVASQVGAKVGGRVTVEPPLSFRAEPSVSHDFVVEPGSVHTWDVRLRPDEGDGPALHPVRFQFFDQQRQVGVVELAASVPFQWLRLGPLKPVGSAPMDHEYGPDRSVDLAERFRGVMRAVGWNRLPSARIGTEGWIRLADADDPTGVHYLFTAFTTGSRESVLRIEADGPATVRINGETVARTPDWGGREETEVAFRAGTNFVLVKTMARGNAPARVRLDLRDIDGQPLRGVENSLERLLDQYAYLTRTRDNETDDRTLDRESMRLVPFTFSAPQASSVSVVGSFNGWSPTATRMVRLDDGRWQVKVRLQPGRFEYKFAVDGSNWISDPANPDAVPDGFGGRNSVLVVE